MTVLWKSTTLQSVSSLAQPGCRSSTDWAPSAQPAHGSLRQRWSPNVNSTSDDGDGWFPFDDDVPPRQRAFLEALRGAEWPEALCPIDSGVETYGELSTAYIDAYSTDGTLRRAGTLRADYDGHRLWLAWHCVPSCTLAERGVRATELEPGDAAARAVGWCIAQLRREVLLEVWTDRDGTITIGAASMPTTAVACGGPITAIAPSHPLVHRTASSGSVRCRQASGLLPRSAGRRRSEAPLIDDPGALATRASDSATHGSAAGLV